MARAEITGRDYIYRMLNTDPSKWRYNECSNFVYRVFGCWSMDVIDLMSGRWDNDGDVVLDYPITRQIIRSFVVHCKQNCVERLMSYIQGIEDAVRGSDGIEDVYVRMAREKLVLDFNVVDSSLRIVEWNNFKGRVVVQ
jgi:hypothetical protein